MLGTAELEILATVNRGDSITEIAANLGHSESYVSRAVSTLAEKGLVYTKQEGRRKQVVPSDARAVELYRDLQRQSPHIEFHDLLTGTTIEVLYHFDRPRTVADLATRSDNYRNTVHRVLKRLQHRGLIGTEDGTYWFNDEFDRLHEFARELVHHRHRHQLAAVAPAGTILWETDDEFLAQTTTAIDAEEFIETGLARFADYGLQFLLTHHRYYFYSERIDALSPADLVCHTLLIDDDTRYRSYCLLVLSEIDIDEGDLRDRASKYGLETAVGELLEYLETNGEARGENLPGWADFRELAADYEVTL